MKILFAPIGDPSNYETVKYKIDDKEYETNACFRAISDHLGIDKVTVYAGLSLCSGCNNLECCIDSVKQKVSQKIGSNFELLIAPNIYGTKFIQKDRRNTLYFNFVYFNSLKILEQSKPDEIYIDITHGINYMPLLATDAIMLATYAYVVENVKDVTLKIYNSEPIMRGNKGPYTIDNIYSEKITVRQALIFLLSFFLSNDSKNVIKNKVLKTNDNEGKSRVTYLCRPDLIYSLVNSLSGGVFPYILMRAQETNECLKKVENLFEKLDFFNNYSVKLTFEQGGVVYEDAMPIEISYLHSLVRGVSRITPVDVERIKISEIRNLANNYSISDAVKYMILNEIDQIENKYGNNIPNQPTLYAKIKEDKVTKPCSVDKRNLLAHGGFEENVTYLWKDKGEIIMSYNGEQECLSEVERQLR
ncbi:CRISPR-associated CARF protein Csx1 [Sulfuracidifex tepidarius]|uniref:CRISPR-associated protein Csx1 n=1 Tax=Sulfuracidifex tepidarius TaxID=1294262 RepID=A0A510E5F2_9CREN|nr:CRISPR-associated CARF protein Csx1 [Sulfuracidifex tepidarius]BBG27763.1 CRISPR-associated protein Csx1 [Sulfuracidifex tepidarius]